MQDSELKKHIGDIVRSYRLKKKMTQEQLSELVDCTCSFISQIERGESKASIPLLCRIIQTLGIDANELFNDSPPLSTEDQQLCNQISILVRQLSTQKKHIILNLIYDLKDLN